MQEDVYRGDGLNLYAYCGNNPVMYVDPSGYGSVTYTDREIVVDGQNVGSANYSTGDYLDINLTSKNSSVTEVTVSGNVSEQIYKDFYQSDPWERGKNIENTIAYANRGDYIQIGDGYNGKFPIVDLANENSVVSIKSLNQFCTSYKSNDNPDVNLVADQIMKYYDAIDDIKMSVNGNENINKSLLVALNGKDEKFKQQVQEEVNSRIAQKYKNIDEDSKVNKKTKCSIV